MLGSLPLPLRHAEPASDGGLGSVTVIILTANQRVTTLRCLGSVLASDQPAPRVLVWDNGSDDGTSEAVRVAFPNVLVHQHPVNLGVASGRNAGAALALEAFQPRYLLFLDNDMVLEPGFVRALLTPLRDDSGVGQTQAKLRLMHDRLRLNDGGGSRINFVLGQTRPVGYGEVDRGQYDMTRPCVACGGAMLIRSGLFVELGGFDTFFDPFGPEDLDLSLRLKKAGYRALYVPQAIAYHEVNHTFGRGYSEAYARYKSRHWLGFLRRHASPAQQLGFFLLGAPYALLRAFVREGRKRNLGALRGWLRGTFDAARGASGPKVGDGRW